MRSFLSLLALVLAAVVTTVALVAYVAHETVLDPERAGEVLGEVLEEPAVRDELLERVVPGYAVLPSSLREEVDRVAQSRPVQDALEEVPVDSRGRADLGPVRDRLTEALRERGYPVIAAQLDALRGPDTVPVPPSVWEPYTQARETSREVATVGAVAAVVLLLVGVLVARGRRGAVAGAGLAVLAGSAAAVLVYLSMPTLAPLVTDDPRILAAAEVAPGYAATAASVLLPVAAVGGVLVVVSLLVPRRR